ncbi:hypothetical protein ECMP02155212_5478 [Escherichia coli MP021552.12]|nr:hypothetical protein ECMP02155212_5478 [Escherichia coli MP021552.12]
MTVPAELLASLIQTAEQACGNVMGRPDRPRRPGMRTRRQAVVNQARPC